MAEDAGAADLSPAGAWSSVISRGSPEQVIDGWRLFRHMLAQAMVIIGLYSTGRFIVSSRHEVGIPKGAVQ